MSTDVIRERKDIPQEDKWALEDIFPTDSAWEESLQGVVDLRDKLVSFDGKLVNAPEALLEYLTLTEDVHVKIDALANYCMRKSDEDTRNSVYQAMTGRFMTAIVELNAATSFDVPQINAITDADMDRFYTACPSLERYRRYLTEVRRMRAHTLSEAEERILAASAEMSQAASGIYSSLMDADMKYPDVADSKGVMHTLSQGTFVALLESSDRMLRKNAYEALYKTLTEFRNTSAGLLDAQNKKLKFYAQMRKYPSAFDASLDGTNVPTAVYRNLISTVHENLDKMHRYIRLRKKILGLDKLYFYDIYTPLVADVDKKIEFCDAKKTVYQALAPMGDEYRRILKEGFESRWIDIYENQGKRSGAYSAGARVHPYVLLNYTGTLDSQFTLAHEMGHAIHSYYSNRTQNPIDADYVIFVAEVASTCNEALLMEYLLSQTTNKRERAYLINHFLDQFRGTIYRQTMFAEFELNIGRMVNEGMTLTPEVLCAEYKRLNELYYGEDIIVDDEIAMEWARIPHFYYDYYVFQYATGYSAAIALSRRILSEGEKAVKDYIGFLSGGCSKSPIELLKGAGVDMTTPDSINSALSLFGKLLDEMEKLMEE